MQGLSTLFFLLALVSATSAVAADRAQQACARIDTIYSACGRKFQVHDGDFHFPRFVSLNPLRCSDGRSLGFYERLEAMDVASIFMFPYKLGRTTVPERRRNFDPGRLRSDELMKSVYGAGERDVRANLVPVRFLGHSIKFQKNLGAANALSRVSSELQAEMRRDRALAEFMKPFTSGAVDLRLYAFAWRKVAGTDRMSSHAYGTGLDLNTNKGAQYWLWDEQRANPAKAAGGENAYRDTHFNPAGTPVFPWKAVEIFEKNGFIWGGKWNHYDTMHFEYRPEFIPDVRIECPGA